MKELLQDAIDQFNQRIIDDEKLRESVEGKTRTVSIDITDGTCYHFRLEENRLTDFDEGSLETADIRVRSDEATLTGILKREIKPLKAYITKKVSFDASLEDLLTLKQFF
jgi:hypothetical protein